MKIHHARKIKEAIDSLDRAKDMIKNIREFGYAHQADVTVSIKKRSGDALIIFNDEAKDMIDLIRKEYEKRAEAAESIIHSVKTEDESC